MLPHRKISARIRFMMKDLLDLKSNNWVPRNQAVNPKTIKQIHQEVSPPCHQVKF